MKVSQELKRFINDNIELVRQDKWDSLFERVGFARNVSMTELYWAVLEAGIKMPPMFGKPAGMSIVQQLQEADYSRVLAVSQSLLGAGAFDVTTVGNQIIYLERTSSQHTAAMDQENCAKRLYNEIIHQVRQGFQILPILVRHGLSFSGDDILAKAFLDRRYGKLSADPPVYTIEYFRYDKE